MAVKVTDKTGQRNTLGVHAPRDINQPGAFERFTASLNGRLDQIAQSLHKVPPLLPEDFDPDDFVRTDEFRDLLDKVDEEDLNLLSTEGEEGGEGGVGVRRARSSRRRRIAQEEAESAIRNAVPTAAPPEVEDAGNVGTTTDPVLFALSDHTHSGVNLGDGQTITGLKTFDRDPAAPFAVTGGSAKVTNLDSDFLDGLSSAAFLILAGQAGGQVANGGTAASEDLTLVSTAHATKDRVFFGAAQASAYDEANERLGIGIAVPLAALHGRESTTGEEVLRLESIFANDDPNYYTKQYAVTTTDATVTTLATITLTASKTYLIEARVVGRRTGGAAGTAEDGIAVVVRGAYKTVAGAATALTNGTPATDFESDDQAAWTATLDTNGTDVRVRVTGAVDNNITWHATVLLQDVGT